MKYTNNTIRFNVLFIICVVLLFCAFIVKVAYVALNDNVEGTDIAQLAENRATVTESIEAERGNIYDSFGNALALNVNSYTVIAYLSSSRTTDQNNPKHVVDKETTAKKLADILYPGEDKYSYILGLLNTSGAYQVELGSGGKNISEYTKNEIEKLDLPGIDFVKTFKRYYPYGDFASYIIGYAKKYNTDGVDSLVGELGIEGYCDRYLKGTDGWTTYQQDAYGYALADKESYTQAAEDGYDIYLTIDPQIQMFLDDAVNKFKDPTYDISWVTITVADASTGAIIGSSSSPSFNPNLLNITDYNNPLTSYAYEPGSTMKIFSFMSAIEEGLYKGDDTYPSGSIQVDDYKIYDWNKTGWGSITYDRGFTYSSNVAAVRLSQMLGKNKLYSYYSKLGYGSQTGIELANEYNGDIGFEYASEVASASYGQGITVTTVQMIQALTTLTNDGTTLKPYVISKIVNPNTGETVYEGKRNEVNKIYSTSTVNKMIDLMDQTVNSEDKAVTGAAYSTDAVRLIGKTGTSNYTGDDGYVEGTYNNIRSFAGVFPKDDPQYIIYVAVKDFHGNTKSMGNIVKSLVENVAKYKNLDKRESNADDSKIVTIPNLINTTTISASATLSSLGVPTVVIGDGSRVIYQSISANTKTSKSSRIFIGTNGTNITMPDMTNWSSKDLVAFCNLIGIKYELNGYGYVSSTSIVPGTVIDTTGDVTLSANLTNINPESLSNEVVSNG